MNRTNCRCSAHGVCRYFAPQALAALAATTLTAFASGASLGSDPANDVPERIEAQALFLTDASGNRRGFLGMNGEQEPMLSITDPQGATRVMVALVNDPETPHHALLNLTCQDQYAELGVNDAWRSYVHLTDQAGKLRLAISTGASRILSNAATDWGNEAWPTVVSLAATGAVRCVFVATPDGGACEVFNEAQRCVLRAGAGASNGKSLPTLPAPVRAFTPKGPIALQLFGDEDTQVRFRDIQLCRDPGKLPALVDLGAADKVRAPAEQQRAVFLDSPESRAPWMTAIVR